MTQVILTGFDEDGAPKLILKKFAGDLDKPLYSTRFFVFLCVLSTLPVFFQRFGSLL
jgi:hypothetical protein